MNGSILNTVFEHRVPLFQYPLYRIVEWFFDAEAGDGARHRQFQYPLYRIVEWFATSSYTITLADLFQYPLYRIVEWFL